MSLVLAGAAQAAAPVGAYTRTGAWRYASKPKLAPPKIKVVKRMNGSFGRGYFLIDNFKNLGALKSNGSPMPMVGQGGPVMYDNKFQPIWVHGVPDDRFSLNFRTQSYNGQPALSWWEGLISPTGVTLSGAGFVANQHYKIVSKLVGEQGWIISPHELVVTNGHFAWVTAYKDIPGQNLAQYGGAPNGKLTDSALQEYDLSKPAGSRLIYTWDALAHIPLSDSQTRPAPPSNPHASQIGWDAYHVNSIQLLPNGQFLTSMRNTWAIYLVNQSTGAIQWTLGGKHSSYAIPSNASFQWQHDAQLHRDGTLSLFDNGCCGFGPNGFLPPNGPTRGLLLRLAASAHAATLVAQYGLSGVSAGSQGNTQLTPNGNVLVGFGQQPYFAGYNKAGTLLFKAQLPYPDESYRAFLSRWTGKPSYAPNAVAQKKGRTTTVYASWNGATAVRSWRVLAGHDAKHLGTVATKTRSGFETAIKLRSSYGAYKVVALDSRRHVLRRSGVFHTSHPAAHHPPPSGLY